MLPYPVQGEMGGRFSAGADCHGNISDSPVYALVLPSSDKYGSLSVKVVNVVLQDLPPLLRLQRQSHTNRISRIVLDLWFSCYSA